MKKGESTKNSDQSGHLVTLFLTPLSRNVCSYMGQITLGSLSPASVEEKTVRKNKRRVGANIHMTFPCCCS